MTGPICPICWERHVCTDRHEVVATTTSGDQLALIAELSSLGVTWPAEFASHDPGGRAYGLLRMIDDATSLGIDFSEVASEWVISCTRPEPAALPALDARLPRSA